MVVFFYYSHMRIRGATTISNLFPRPLNIITSQERRGCSRYLSCRRFGDLDRPLRINP